MSLLLVFLLGSVVVGLLSDRLTFRIGTAIVASSAVVTLLYFTSQRFWS